MRIRAAVAAVALLLAGCSGGSGGSGGKEPAPVAAGFQEYRGDGFTFSYPEGWRQVTEKDERGHPVVKLNGMEQPSGAYDGQVHLSRWDGYPRDGLDLQLAQFRALAVVNSYTITASRPWRLDGAAQAQRVEATYTISGDGGLVPYRLLGLYVLTERKALLELMLRSPVGGSADPGLGKIFDSFRLTAT